MTASDASREMPEISVVLVFRGDEAAILRCFHALRDDSVRSEMIVVHPAPRPWSDPPAGVKLLAYDSEDVGWLRAAGIAAATAPLVALTRDDARAAAGWLRHFITEHRHDDAAAIGGPVLAAPQSGKVALAAYLTEYSRFASARPESDARDLAATNVCYKLAALPLDRIAREGFRETSIHDGLRQAGCRLRYDPAFPVILVPTMAALPFMRERFFESRRFAEARAAAATTGARLALRFGSVLLPGVFTARTFARAFRNGRGRDLLRALPLVVLFHLVAAAGEAAGYWAARRRPPHDTPTSR